MFKFILRAQNTDTHALDQHGVMPQIILPSDPISMLISTSGMHVEPIEGNQQGGIIDFGVGKHVPKQSKILLIYILAELI